MKQRIELIGGPVDGEIIEMRSPAQYLWIPRLSRQGFRRLLYQRISDGKYGYVKTEDATPPQVK